MKIPLSIIIPTKNEEAYLARLLDSITSQTAQPTEIIVADANSTDKTREIAKEYGCKIVKGGNHPSIGRNGGAAAATEPLLLFLDADVILPDKDFLVSTVNEFKKRDLGVACCLAQITSSNIVDRLGAGVINTYFVLTESFFKNGVGYCTFVYKNIHDKIGGYNEKMVITEDQDYVTRASKLGKFRFLRSKKIIVSIRRYEHEGRIKLFFKYLQVTSLLITRKKITNEKITYSFNHSYAKKPEKK